MGAGMVRRLEKLTELLAQDPKNALVSYGLAQELANLGRLEEAVAEFERLIAGHPDYHAGYFHGARTLERLNRIGDARNLYRRGMEAAARNGDAHAQSEMQAALEALG